MKTLSQNKMFKLKINCQGFSFVEILVVTAILLVVVTGLYMNLSAGQTAWSTTESQIEIRKSIQQAIQRVAYEVRETGSDEIGNMKITIDNGGGINGTDKIRFSIPVMCSTSASVIDADGEVSYWGAPLTWGCKQSSCMDADNDCATVDYKYVEYLISASNQLVRRVLNASGGTVREDIFEDNISNFQADLSTDQKTLTVMITAAKMTGQRRQITGTRVVNIYLRNKRG